MSVPDIPIEKIIDVNIIEDTTYRVAVEI